MGRRPGRGHRARPRRPTCTPILARLQALLTAAAHRPRASHRSPKGAPPCPPRQASTTDKVRALHDRLTAQVEALVTGEDWARFLAVASRFHSYSANNVLLILPQRPDATRVAGYRTWQRLGRQVNKGAKGIAILAPCVYRRRPVDDAEAAENPALVRVLRGFTVVHVFDLLSRELSRGTISAPGSRCQSITPETSMGGPVFTVPETGAGSACCIGARAGPTLASPLIPSRSRWASEVVSSVRRSVAPAAANRLRDIGTLLEYRPNGPDPGSTATSDECSIKCPAAAGRRYADRDGRGGTSPTRPW